MKGIRSFRNGGRAALIAFGVLLLLAACGGGGEDAGNNQGNGDGSGSGGVVSPPPAPPADPPVLALSVVPGSVTAGSSVVVSWSGAAITSCTASGAWSGARATSGSQTMGPLQGNSTYTLSCQGAGGTVSQSVNVEVTPASPTPPPPPPVITLISSASSVIQGGSVTLTWTSTGATNCIASGAWSGPRSISGSTIASLQATSTFTLSCQNEGGTSTQAVTVSVGSSTNADIPPELPSDLAPATALHGRAFELLPGRVAHDVAVDPARHRMYVSMLNEVVVLSTDTYLIEQRVKVGGSPRGLALSADYRRLYAALYQGGSIAVVDTVTFSTSVIEVVEQTATAAVLDVLEVQPGIVLVLGACSYGSTLCTSYPVTVDTTNSNAIRRVAQGRPLFGEPESRLSRDGRTVYIGGGDEPGRRILKLDNTSADLPVTGTGNFQLLRKFEVNDSGTMLMTGGGTSIRTSDLTVLRAGFVDGGIGLDTGRGQMLLRQSRLQMVDSLTLAPTTGYRPDCVGNGTIFAMGHHGQWAQTYSSSGLCIFSVDTPATAPGAEGIRSVPGPASPVDAFTLQASVRPLTTDMAVDFARDRIYVTGSASTTNSLTLISASNRVVTGEVAMPGSPRRLQLSSDGTTLMIGLRDRPSVLVVDAQTLAVQSEVNLGALAGGSMISTLFELSPSRWLASAPHQGGTSPPLPLIEFNPGAPQGAQVFGDPRGYCDPTPFISRDRRSLYIPYPDCNGTIEKRDFTRADTPVVARSPNNYWGIMGSFWAAESEDGSLLYLPQGYVMRASNMMQVGKFDVFGRPFLAPDNRVMFVNGPRLDFFDRSTYDRVAIRDGYCPADDNGFNSSMMNSFTVWPDFLIVGTLGLGNAHGTQGGVCFVGTQ